MLTTKDFLLERFVCQVFNGQARASRALVEKAIREGLSPEAALCQLIWPTLECVETLRRDGVIGRNTHKTVLMILRGIAAETGLRLSRAASLGANALICFSQPVTNELPAQIMADIADAAGWDVTWIGSFSSDTAIMDALRLNHPRVVLLCAPHDSNQSDALQKMERFHAVMPWARFLLFPIMPVSSIEWQQPQNAALVRDPAELVILLNEFIGSELICNDSTSTPDLRFRY